MGWERHDALSGGSRNIELSDVEPFIVLYKCVFEESDGREPAARCQSEQEMPHLVEGELEHNCDNQRDKAAYRGDCQFRYIDIFMHRIVQAFTPVDNPYQQCCKCQSDSCPYDEAADHF